MSVLDPGAAIGHEPASGPQRRPSRIVPSFLRRTMPDETTWSVWWAFIRHPFKKGTIARVINRYGVYSTALRCSTCGNRVWVTPDIENGSKSWQSCLADDCPSYDPHRDVSFLMSAEKE